MKKLVFVVALLFLGACSQSEPVAVAVEETSVAPPEPVQVDTLIYKLLETERVDKVGSLDAKGYFVRARYRVTNTAEPVWVSLQYSQLETNVGTYEQDQRAAYEVRETATRLMPQNDWTEADVYFDIPSEEIPDQLLIKSGPDALAAKFDIHLG